MMPTFLPLSCLMSLISGRVTTSYSSVFDWESKKVSLTPCAIACSAATGARMSRSTSAFNRALFDAESLFLEEASALSNVSNARGVAGDGGVGDPQLVRRQCRGNGN